MQKSPNKTVTLTNSLATNLDITLSSPKLAEVKRRARNHLSLQTSFEPNAQKPNFKELFTGTSAVSVYRAAQTYMNSVGPGQYNLQSMFGKQSETRKRNLPSITFGSKVKAVPYKELVKELLGTHSPAAKYDPKVDASSLRLSPSQVSIGKSPRFFEPLELGFDKHLKGNVPVQYQSTERNKVTLQKAKFDSLILDRDLPLQKEKRYMSNSPDYVTATRLVLQQHSPSTISKSKRSDFTKLPQQDFNNVSYYDPLKSISFANAATKNVKHKKDYSTFGSPFTDKAVLVHAPQHYFGRGPEASSTLNQSVDFVRIKRKRQRNEYKIYEPVRNPELIAAYRQQPGVGDYKPQRSLDFLEHSNNHRGKKFGNFSTFAKSGRDIAFQKYASINAPIYTKGLV